MALASLVSICHAQDNRQVVLSSPIVADTSSPDNEPGVQAVTVDAQILGRMKDQAGSMTIERFPLADGSRVRLSLRAFSVLAPGASIVVGTATGDVPMAMPDVRLYHGEVIGDVDSLVFLSFSSDGVNGLIQTRGTTYVLSQDGYASDRQLVIADLAKFPEPPEFAKGWVCGTDESFVIGDAVSQAEGQQGTRDHPCRIARVAVDSDYEFSAWKFGGDVQASAAYAITLFGAINEIYTRDLNVHLVMTYLRVWEDNVDPYHDSGGSLLDEFRNEWNATMGNVPRDLAHLLSGDYGGGVAWVSVLCSQSYGYGLSGVGGSFPYPLVDHDYGNWDLFVVSHEMGHNFGTLHTHDGYDPPLDGCGLGDCSQAWGGTIMSYCHLCSGGMSNIVLHFHPVVNDKISTYLDGACDILGDHQVWAYDDAATGLANTSVAVDVLANDATVNCVGIGLFSVQSQSDMGGSVTISTGSGSEGRDEVVYTPPTDFVGTDSFVYFLQADNGQIVSADVTVEVLPVYASTDPGVSRPGVTVDYYALDSAEQLPDFSTLSPYMRDVLPDVNIPSSNGDFATSGRYEFVGAVFDGLVEVPEKNLYTFFLESDDGSRLFVDDQLVLDNDGLHRMTEKSGDIALEAGFHRLRIEYFEKTQAQGLIARMESSNMPKQVIPASSWRTDACIADWVSDGSINTIDFLAFLGEWTAGNANTDLDNNGIVNTADVVAYINAWVAGC